MLEGLGSLRLGVQMTAAVPESAREGPLDVGGILFREILDRPFLGLPSRHLAFLLLAALLVLVIARLALRGYRAGVPHGLAALVELLVLFIRDEVAIKEMGEEAGRRFTPLLLSFFFFILTAALLGLFPFAAISTSNIAVTAGLAAVSFVAQQAGGIRRHGLTGHVRHLVPPGLPFWLLPIMIPVEILSLFTKPFALMIRLFANMLAGHMVIAMLLLLIPLLASISPWLGWAVVPVSLTLALFIMMLELLVAFVQAYIFTLLTAIFIASYASSDH
jgi:F-type H+-transporting ATPase subunit a